MKKKIIKTSIILIVLAFLLVPSMNPLLDEAGKAAVSAQIQNTFGGLLGVLANVTRLDPAHRDREMLVHFNLCQVATHVVCWAGIAPVLELLLYSESMDRIFEQGLTAALSNAVTTAIVSSILLCAYAAHHTKKS
mgnify:CR=1 FL=1